MADLEKNQSNQQKKVRYTDYIDGSAVRQLQPLYEEESREKKSVSRQVRHNRAKATSMSLGFVLFLGVVCVALLFTCVSYVQMKSEISDKETALASLESDYAQLKADNDAYYSQVSSSADIENIKAIAIKRLGMKYATEDQVITYKAKRSSYVKQYQDVPEAE